MTPEEYDQMFEAQRGLCALCGAPFGGGFLMPHLDHNHRTGRPRAILHARCNQLLHAVESIPFREMALAYLKEHATA